MQLRWKTSFSASCLHAAACLHEGLPVSDQVAAAVLQPPTDALLQELGASGLVPESILPLLVEYAGDLENNRQLVEMAANRLLGVGAVDESALSRLAGCIADLEAAWLRHQPRLVDELAVRGRPLLEQWEARGPGLLRAIEKLTTEELLAPAAEVVLVSPLVGGHGRAHLLSNRVTFEAVLTHPYSELPETVRLGWLLTQLHLDLPKLGETVPSFRLPRLASLATLPLVLAAAKSVELTQVNTQFNQATLGQAITYWHVAPPTSAELPQQLLDWWHAYSTSDTRWPVALAALDAMVGESS